MVGRAVQGLGGAAVSAVALALIMGLFTDPGERAKAMGVFGFVMSGGGAVGVLLGGVLTGLFSWHWIFLVNVPIGIGVWLAARRVLPADDAARAARPARRARCGARDRRADARRCTASSAATRRLDLGPARVVLLGGGLVLLARSWSARPGSPARWCRCGCSALRNVVVSQVVGVLWAAAMFAWFFLAALYLQQVLGYGALEVGLAFLPTSVVMAYCSLQVSDKLVMRFGIRPPLVVGPGAGRGQPGAVLPRPGGRQLPRPTCCPRCCCSAPARASRSTRCCSRRWATSSRTRPVSPRAS